MSGVVRRLAIGLIGQGLWRAALALNPVLLVPILIAHWGIDLFGQWLTISALVSYLSYAGLGVVTTATNDLIMAVAAGDDARALRSFQMALNLALGPFPLILAALVAIMAALPLAGWFHLTDFTASTVVLIFALAALQLCFETVRGLMAAVLYATGCYGISYNVATAAKLVELAAAICAVALFSARPVHVAAVTAATALVDLSVVALLARRAAPWARIDPRIVDVAWLRRQLKPALGFSGYNFAIQGIMLQGPRLVLGVLLGGPSVAIYAVYATAMRLVDQLFLAVMAPVGVEISHAAGRRDSRQLVRLLAIVAQISALAFLAVALLLMGAGPVIFAWWTHHQITFHHGLMALYLAMSLAGLPGRIAAQALISVNAMRAVAAMTLVSACIAITLGAALVPALGIGAVIVGGIIGEASTSLLLFGALHRWLGLPLQRLFVKIGDIAGSLAQVRHQARILFGKRGT